MHKETGIWTPNCYCLSTVFKQTKCFNLSVHLCFYSFFVFNYSVFNFVIVGFFFSRERLNFAFQGSMWISLLLYVRHLIQVQGSTTATCKNLKTSSLMWRYWLISFCCEKLLNSCVLLLYLQQCTLNIYCIVLSVQTVVNVVACHGKKISDVL